MKTIKPLNLKIIRSDLDRIAKAKGIIVVLVTPQGALDPYARRVNKLTRGSLTRLISSKKFEEADSGQLFSIYFPERCAAEQICVVKIKRRTSKLAARQVGVSIAKMKGSDEILLALGNFPNLIELCKGIVLREYKFDFYKVDVSNKSDGSSLITVMTKDPELFNSQLHELVAIRDGVFLTRNLINEPSNILTTEEFASRLEELSKLGIKIEILDEDDLRNLGMNAFLGVGQGSSSPCKLVIMSWLGAADDDALLTLVGKGVVFDTGGISLKPAGGMEDMTMDMGGAAVVAGVLATLAKRKSPSNVVGLVGLVENMPSGTAQRPGDVVKSMKGDTIEVINTDAEGRLVLADVLTYVQKEYNPEAIIDLATLTGAIIVSLGKEYAGLFSNSNKLSEQIIQAGQKVSEKSWRMPMEEAYNKQLVSHIADIKNIGGAFGGSITAACFLNRFIKNNIPWAHLDIAGKAWSDNSVTSVPKGATGYGVRLLNQVIDDWQPITVGQ